MLEKIPLDSETRAVLRREPGLLRPIYQWMLARESGEWEAARSICNSPRLAATSWPHLVLAGPTVGPRSLQGRVKSRVCLVIGLQLSTSTNTGMQSVSGQSSQFEAGDPKLLETTGDVLLCKTRPLCHLRACTRTSTINLFLLASFPRRPSASQAVPGGATDPTTDNRYADIFIFSPIRVCFTRCG
jgi:hypothetical protein